MWDLHLDCCCAEDVYDAILRAGARLNLPILPLAERISGQKWDLPSPPPKASPWVDEMCMHLQMFRERLRQIKSLTDPILRQVGFVSERMWTIVHENESSKLDFGFSRGCSRAPAFAVLLSDTAVCVCVLVMLCLTYAREKKGKEQPMPSEDHHSSLSN